MRPETYHLVWTTYGTWLPGDARGWVQSGVQGVQPPDSVRENGARAAMSQDAVTLSESQREIVARTIRDHCGIRDWTLHAVNVRSNHIHVVVSADCPASDAVSQFKAWSSRRLSDAAGLRDPVARKAGRRRWFTEGANWKLIETEEYLENAVRYVQDGQDAKGEHA